AIAAADKSPNSRRRLSINISSAVAITWIAQRIAFFARTSKSRRRRAVSVRLRVAEAGLWLRRVSWGHDSTTARAPRPRTSPSRVRASPRIEREAARDGASGLRSQEALCLLGGNRHRQAGDLDVDRPERASRREIERLPVGAAERDVGG